MSVQKGNNFHAVFLFQHKYEIFIWGLLKILFALPMQGIDNGIVHRDSPLAMKQKW